MRNILKSTVLWQFAAGFALGAIGMVSLYPAEAKAVSTPSAQHVAR